MTKKLVEEPGALTPIFMPLRSPNDLTCAALSWAWADTPPRISAAATMPAASLMIFMGVGPRLFSFIGWHINRPGTTRLAPRSASSSRLCRSRTRIRTPDQQAVLDLGHQQIDRHHEHRQHDHAGKHAGDIEHAFGLLDQIAKPCRRTQILADHRADHGKPDRGMQR